MNGSVYSLVVTYPTLNGEGFLRGLKYVKSLVVGGDWMVRMWHVVFDGLKPGPEGDFTLRFVEFTELILPFDFFTMTPQFVKNLEKLIESEDHYNVFGNIKEVYSPEGKDWSDKQVWALLGAYKMKTGQEARMGVLLYERPDKDWGVLGLGPPNIAQLPFISKNFVVNFVQSFTQRPDKFRAVDVVTPLKPV